MPFVAARIAVGAALAVARELSSTGNLGSAAAGRAHQGLLGWDAGWYEAIARGGYSGAGHPSLRFFPVVPLLARGLAELPGVGVGLALVVVANVSALIGMALVAELARRETGDTSLARRATWLLAMAPPAFVLVMGYAEGTLLAFGAATFLALRNRRWGWAAGFGLLAGATRPLGVVLALPALIEVASHAPRRHGWLRWPGGGPVAAVLAAPAGCGAYLAWVGWRYGNAFAPFSIQQQGRHRGAVADPLVTAAHDLSLLFHGRHLSQALHLPWLVLAAGLLLVVACRWPASYAWFAGAVLAVAVTASNLDGFERYALSAFPLVLGGATVTSSARVERTVLTVAAAGLVGYAVLAFCNVYVP